MVQFLEKMAFFLQFFREHLGRGISRFCPTPCCTLEGADDPCPLELRLLGMKENMPLNLPFVESNFTLLISATRQGIFAENEVDCLNHVKIAIV